MTKISNQYSLTNVLTADTINSRVGIGTSNPTNPLHVSGAGSTLIKIQNTASGADVGLHLVNTAVTAFMGANATEAFIYTQTNHPILFYTNLTEKMRITASGSVGIGTNSPNQLLTLSSAAYPILGFNIGSTAHGYVGSLNATGIILNSQQALPIFFYTSDTERMRITAAGNVGVGTSSPSSKFSVVGNTSTIGTASIGQNTNGTAVIDAFNSFAYYGCNGSTFAIWIGPTGLVYNYSNTTTFNTTSDIRVKQNISTVSNALDTISKLNPVTFDYNKDFAEKRTWNSIQKNNNIGFIAQEFETVFPKYVNVSEEVIGGKKIEDFKSIDTGHLVPLLVKAIQEQQTQINELKALINA